MDTYEKKYNDALERAKAYHRNELAGTKKEMTEYIFPELRESEDERIRKALIDIFSSINKKDWRGIPSERILAWLEKQKEQKSAEYTLQSSWSTTNEQKPMGWKPQAESLGALMYAVEGHWDMIKPTSYLSRRLEDLYEGLVNTYHVDESYLRKLSEVAYTTDDIEELKALKDKIEASMEQKPVDTSDFKTKLAEYLQNNSPKDGKYVISAESILKMAEEELLKRGVVQKPAEWNEEDKRTIDTIVSVLGQYIDYKTVSGTGSGYATPRYSKEIDWLKSLRPQQKVELSEDVEKTLDEVSHILIGLNYKQVAKDYKQAIEELISLRPSWKPSEEQMNALNALNCHGDLSYVGQQNQLISLQKDLEKLM